MRYIKLMSKSEMKRLLTEADPERSDAVIASLAAGRLKLDAVVFQGSRGPVLSFDLYVRDAPDSPEWIFYDSVPGLTALHLRRLERDMRAAFSELVIRGGLSTSGGDGT